MYIYIIYCMNYIQSKPHYLYLVLKLYAFSIILYYYNSILYLWILIPQDLFTREGIELFSSLRIRSTGIFGPDSGKIDLLVPLGYL